MAGLRRGNVGHYILMVAREWSLWSHSWRLYFESVAATEVCGAVAVVVGRKVSAVTVRVGDYARCRDYSVTLAVVTSVTVAVVAGVTVAVCALLLLWLGLGLWLYYIVTW